MGKFFGFPSLRDEVSWVGFIQSGQVPLDFSH